ncbi:MAG: sialidase family protein [Pirellulaceae bacterium]
MTEAVAWFLVVLGAATGPFEWDAASCPGPGFKTPIQLSNGDILAASTVRLSPAGGAVRCYRSRDLGETWMPLGEIARDTTPKVDLGDGTFLERRGGELLFVYRHNFDYYFDEALAEKDHTYRIEIAISRDHGSSWQPHSTVKTVQGTRMGLWSPSLFERSDGTLQCYYDDEHWPEQQGLRGHQWTAMQTWNAARHQWADPVVVSRAHDPAHLSRDGMCSVVELPGGRLLAAIESVQTTPPHRGCTRRVTSEDGGKTWSWNREERSMLYAPEDPTFNSLSPWLIRLSEGTLLAVFTTDEDRSEPGECALQRLDLDLKYVISRDQGATWLAPKTVIVPAAYEQRRMWRYTVAAPTADWMDLEFDAQRWSEGPAGFGIPSTPGICVGTPWLTNDLWLRQTFCLEEAPLKHPRLRVYHKADAEVYINGVLTIRLAGSATGYRYYPLSTEARLALRPGENVLAVHSRPTTDSPSIDVGLHDMQNIIDEDHPILFPGACEVKSVDGKTTVLVQYSRPTTRRTKRGVLGQ